MEIPLTNLYPDQMNTHAQQEESVLAGNNTRPVSPLEIDMNSPILSTVSPETAPDSENPRPDSANEKTCTRFCKSWEAFLLQPWKMVLLLLIGTIFAIAHHLFYLYLDGKEGDAQSLMFRYGTIIAFCAKASFGTAVTMAFQQRAWLVVRRRTARLDTVDSIFTANTEFTSLLDWRAIKKAKVSTCLALYCWLTPLVVIMTSETLSAVSTVRTDSVLCPSVRTLNFANEEFHDWVRPLTIDNRPEISLSSWNATFDLKEKPTDEELTEDNFYYLGLPSERIDLVLARTIYQRKAVLRDTASNETCPDSWDCSYTIAFKGPGYYCKRLASGVGSKVDKLDNSQAPFNTSMIVPEGNYTYLAVTDRGEYGQQLERPTAGGKPNFDRPFPKNLGAFRTEPIIWIGYAEVNSTSVRQPTSRSEPDWYKAYNPVIFGCQQYETRYTVEFKNIGGVQSYRVRKQEFLWKVVDTTYLPDQKDEDERLADRTVATPEEAYVFPYELRKYRRIAAYHSIGHSLRQYLNGSISLEDGMLRVFSKIRDTSLLSQPHQLPVEDLDRKVQDLFENLLMSLLSEPDLVVVSWASTGKPSGNATGGPETSYPCDIERAGTLFTYDMPQLLAVYLVSFALAVIGVLLGFQAVREEGLMRDMKPSSIIEATRAPGLNELGPGGDLDKSNVKVGYGLVQHEAGGSLRSFGLEGSVLQQRRRL